MSTPHRAPEVLDLLQQGRLDLLDAPEEARDLADLGARPRLHDESSRLAREEQRASEAHAGAVAEAGLREERGQMGHE